jgi:S-disulfanyl-L-cysteine oxidoreductase SoxD
MSTRSTVLVAAALILATSAAAETPGLGQSIKEADLALWDISIGPDGVGLPPGSGTAAHGKAVYEQKCELCHGKEASGGRNAKLVSTTDRTVTNYVPHATTIFDTYAVTAYLLALAKIIGENDVMNAQTLPKVQMPNRDGFVSKYPEKR